MNVIIREAAYADLDRIFAWISKDRHGVEGSVVSRILDDIGRLATFPYLGRRGRAPQTLEWVVPGLPYIVVYEVHEDFEEIAVTAIFHAAQDRS